MLGPIPGISKTTLWNTWKVIRRELKHSSRRDVIDLLEYDIAPDKWIGILLKQISAGQYEPATPFRFTLGKSNGFSRTMTFPAVPDLVIYRTIADSIYRKLRRKEHKHVYFRRQFLESVQKAAEHEAQEEIKAAHEYRLASRSSFLNWLRFAQYRKQLLLQDIHPYFVVTDIANFFDSILHSHVEEALRGISLHPRMLGLLFFLLERLSIRQDYSTSHAISLPVDEFDCSRTLAHVILLAHDKAMVQMVGEDNYVRWMDDQNMGVGSRAEGLRLLAEVNRSLAQLHLTPNAKKSQILTLAEARRHFHLDINALLDRADKLVKNKLPLPGPIRLQLSRQVRDIWNRARKHEGKGEFGKILSRIYRLAGLARLRFLRRRAPFDLLQDPKLSSRVLDYMRCSGTVGEYLQFVDFLLISEEQVYSDVNVSLIESLLRAEPKRQEAVRARRIASALLNGSIHIPGAHECMAIAPLVLLRFGDKRSLSLLQRCFENKHGHLPAAVIRSAGIVFASFGILEFKIVRRAASKLLRNNLAEWVRLIERVRDYDDVPLRYKARLAARVDVVSGRKYVDMRAVLTARLLLLSDSKKVRQWINDWKKTLLSDGISTYDSEMLGRLF